MSHCADCKEKVWYSTTFFEKLSRFSFCGANRFSGSQESPYIFRPEMCVVFMTTATCPYPEPPQFPFLKYFNIILPTTTVSSKLSLSLWFSNQNPVCISLLPHTPRVPCTSLSSWFHHPNHWSLQTKKPNITQLTPTHSKTANTIFGQTVCGRQEEYFRIACWRRSSCLLTAIIIHGALILLYGQSRRMRKIPSPQ